MTPHSPVLRLVLALLATVPLVAACGDGDGGGDGTDASADEVALRLGYFPNITHAPALVGVGADIFERTLGDGVTLETQTFNAGPEAVEALFAGALDASFIGPNPAINAYAQSDGEAIRIVSGSTSGGAFLVVEPEITTAADLEGASLATPQLGNTQDVALRTWLSDQGLTTDTSGGGDVSIVPQENAATLDAFKAGEIDGAWVPEPWATRLIQEGGGVVLVDERDLWPDGRYVTTHLIVRTEYLEQHPDVVRGLLYGELEAIEYIAENGTRAQHLVNDEIEAITDKRIADQVIQGAWPNFVFTVDPIASSLQQSASDAIAAGLLDEVDLSGIYSLDLLNEVLADTGLDPVEGL
jgi:NitT/TauT family transport system substrate-binding protein